MTDTPPQGYKRLAGSERQPLPNAHIVGPVDPNERIEATIYLRPPTTSNLADKISEQVQQQSAPLSREEYNATQSAAPEDMAKVEQFARDHNLTVVSVEPNRRRIVLAGTAAAMSAAFATELQKYEHPDGSYRGRTGHLHIPEALEPIIVGVFGLDNRPQARPHLQRYEQTPGSVHANATTSSYTPLQLANLYDFPTGNNGSGQCIALIELGGGYVNSDLQAYFQKLGIALPRVTSVSVDGGQNTQPALPIVQMAKSTWILK